MGKSERQGFDISGFSAAVIGCGGLGCHVASHLAGAGIGRLFLCDFDTVGESNLNRQFLYTPRDVGALKAETCAAKLREYAPDTQCIPVNGKITDKDSMVCFSGCDIILAAVDNVPAREAVGVFCSETGLPMVNGGINGFYGSAYLYIPGLTPCPSCVGMLSGGEQKILNITTAAGIIGALEAELAIKYLLGKREDAGFLFVLDEGEITKLRIRPRRDCGRCRSN